MKGKLQFLQSLEQHFTDPGSAMNTIKTGCQVFLVELMTFPEPYVCFVIHMSHLVGDAKTLYDIVGQLNATLAGRAITALDWECPARNSFELLPLSLKDRQTVINYGCFGWLGQLLFGPARQNHVSLLSKSLIQQEKEKLKTSKSDYLSSNDIITSALSRSIKNSYVMNVAVNMRNRAGVPGNVAGNYWHNVPMDHQAAQDPNTIRAHLPKLEYYKDGEVPCWLKP
eukprot:Skav206951  [mRNA]  locus=scaffold6419:17837:18514:- [translate_table: standard]